MLWIVALSLAILLLVYAWTESWMGIFERGIHGSKRPSPRLALAGSETVAADAYTSISSGEPPDAQYPGSIYSVGRCVVYRDRIAVSQRGIYGGLWEYKVQARSVVWITDSDLAVLSASDQLLVVSVGSVHAKKYKIPHTTAGQVPMSLSFDGDHVSVWCGRPDVYTPVSCGGTVFRFAIETKN